MSNDTSFLYQQVMRYLAQLTLEHLHTPNYKLPPEIEIAKEQNVSRITVRKAFEEMCALNFFIRTRGKGTTIHPRVTKDMLAPFLAPALTKKAKTIALILPLPPTESQHLVEIFSAVLEAASDMHLLVSVSNMSLEREQTLINEYLSMGVDGILLYPTDNEVYNPTLIKLAASNFPIVLLDRYLPGLDFCYVAPDHKAAATMAVKHLLERGNEHILFFNANTKTNTSLTLRQESYIETLSEYDNYNNYFFTFNGDSDPTSKTFCEKFRQYLNTHGKVTGIIAADYASGLHLLQIRKELHIPEDAFDAVYLDLKAHETQFLPMKEIPTYVSQNSGKLGEYAVALLKAALAGKNIRNTNELISVRLVEGTSTKRLPDEEC